MEFDLNKFCQKLYGWTKGPSYRLSPTIIFLICYPWAKCHYGVYDQFSWLVCDNTSPGHFIPVKNCKILAILKGIN